MARLFQRAIGVFFDNSQWVMKRRAIKRDSQSEAGTKTEASLSMFLIPCSCGTTFAVAKNYDRQGTAWSRYLTCPGCSKKHDPKNRLLQMGFHSEGYWKVDKC
jgi:hydrogenase maturation factor HypF (carbamoyltransferase family)